MDTCQNIFTRHRIVVKNIFHDRGYQIFFSRQWIPTCLQIFQFLYKILIHLKQFLREAISHRLLHTTLTTVPLLLLLQLIMTQALTASLWYNSTACLRAVPQHACSWANSANEMIRRCSVMRLPLLLPVAGYLLSRRSVEQAIRYPSKRKLTFYNYFMISLWRATSTTSDDESVFQHFVRIFSGVVWRLVVRQFSLFCNSFRFHLSWWQWHIISFCFAF